MTMKITAMGKRLREMQTDLAEREQSQEDELCRLEVELEEFVHNWPEKRDAWRYKYIEDQIAKIESALNGADWEGSIDRAAYEAEALMYELYLFNGIKLG